MGRSLQGHFKVNLAKNINFNFVGGAVIYYKGDTFLVGYHFNTHFKEI